MLTKLFVLGFLLIFGEIALAQEIVTLPTRPGATQSYLLPGAPEQAKAVALLFPGSGGLIRLRREEGEIKFDSDNFLVRSRGEFVDRGVSTVIVDAPSDQQNGYGMSHEFRFGQDHFKDITAVVADLQKRFSAVPMFLVGASRGTLSAASLAARLGQQISGVVLTATMFNPTGRRSPSPSPGLSKFDLGTIKAPLLLVHHVDDRCNVTPYGGAASFAQRYALISVLGGLPAKSSECEALSAHGFYGKERETIEEIVNWMLKKPFRTNVQ